MRLCKVGIQITMEPEQEERFRTDHGLADDEDLGPYLAHVIQERLRQVDPFFESVETEHVRDD
ncbi:hypothetical protein [Nocardiopsis sp. FIRDI 009]|uniref:hypothetical protein n=1 Tax=Nocardiopsis sp. FIRDI 009 TaxID=714197 RepID=UPI000E282C0E|nr:hypothetical protein [Nocardiopsis sp. FIRDI 009]